MGILYKYANDPRPIITVLTSDTNFQAEALIADEKYADDIAGFINLVNRATSSAHLLELIRNPSIKSEQRMSYLKLFRRCVCKSLDTEQSKKIKAIPTIALVNSFGMYFADINTVKQFFNTDFNYSYHMALACLLSEYDSRGQSGYSLSSMAFKKIEELYPQYRVNGPSGAGRDIELNTIYPNFRGGRFPCDFVVIDRYDNDIKSVGFCRYDSTRGGAQSDDRTGGNKNKVDQVIQHFNLTGELIKILFVSDGPGLIHKDTWEETLTLDESWHDNVRVSTYLTLEEVTDNWL